MNQGSCGKMDMMEMYFHTGKCQTILFKDIKTSTNGEMIAACFVIFVSAFLYEGLKTLRGYCMQWLPPKKNDEVGYGKGIRRALIRMASSGHLLQTFLHMIQIFWSYVLMLVFMTYNVWLCVFLILGATVGYLSFAWTKTGGRESAEHCH